VRRRVAVGRWGGCGQRGSRITGPRRGVQATRGNSPPPRQSTGLGGMYNSHTFVGDLDTPPGAQKKAAAAGQTDPYPPPPRRGR
jgi:hypothetical protein